MRNILTHGKRFIVCPKKNSQQKWLCRLLFAICALPCVIHGKALVVYKTHFAVWLRHTANRQHPRNEAASRNDRK